MLFLFLCIWILRNERTNERTRKRPRDNEDQSNTQHDGAEPPPDRERDNAMRLAELDPTFLRDNDDYAADRDFVLALVGRYGMS